MALWQSTWHLQLKYFSTQDPKDQLSNRVWREMVYKALAFPLLLGVSSPLPASWLLGETMPQTVTFPSNVTNVMTSHWSDVITLKWCHHINNVMQEHSGLRAKFYYLRVKLPEFMPQTRVTLATLPTWWWHFHVITSGMLPPILSGE